MSEIHKLDMTIDIRKEDNNAIEPIHLYVKESLVSFTVLADRVYTVIAVVRREQAKGHEELEFLKDAANNIVAGKSIGEISDGYHTYDELYDFRKAYNACLFNEWYQNNKYNVHKSYRHNDNELCFGGGWFVVVANTPFGQITNHYKNEDWSLFNVEVVDKAKEAWDGHDSKEALSRLLSTASMSFVIGG